MNDPAMEAGPPPEAGASDDTAERRAWMGLMAKAPGERLTALAAEYLESLGDGEDAPAFRTLRPAETGLVMVRGRAGGSGAPFNMGEMTVTRCAVVYDDPAAGAIAGHAYIAGRDAARAEAAARLDALLQSPTHHDGVRRAVLAQLASARTETRAVRRRKIGATKVDFFTMVRGED